MRNKIKKLFDKQGFVVIKGALNFNQDLKPVLHDMEFVMNRLTHNFVSKKNRPKIFQLDLKKKFQTKNK